MSCQMIGNYQKPQPRHESFQHNQQSKNIAFLQDGAFDSSGKLTFSTGGKPMLVMVKASWCGHCKHAQPGFQDFADKFSDQVMCACIREGEGQTASEKTLMSRLRTLMPSFGGFPHYVLYVDGSPVNATLSERSMQGYVKMVSPYVHLAENYKSRENFSPSPQLLKKITACVVKKGITVQQFQQMSQQLMSVVKQHTPNIDGNKIVADWFSTRNSWVKPTQNDIATFITVGGIAGSLAGIADLSSRIAPILAPYGASFVDGVNTREQQTPGWLAQNVVQACSYPY